PRRRLRAGACTGCADGSPRRWRCVASSANAFGCEGTLARVTALTARHIRNKRRRGGGGMNPRFIVVAATAAIVIGCGGDDTHAPPNTAATPPSTPTAVAPPPTSAPTTAATDATPPPKPSMMDQQKKAGMAFDAAFNGHDAKALAAIYSTDATMSHL